MDENIKELKKKFDSIKDMGYVKSLRSGTTGIGYTFETLLGKKEDQEITPDYKGIEIKCKLGNTKYDLNLFTCAAKRNGIITTNYIFQKYSYHLYDNDNYPRLFCRKIYFNNRYELHNYSFKLDIDYTSRKIKVNSYQRKIFCEEVCYWDFDDIKNHLYTKLKNLAIVTGYFKYIKNEKYYKYYAINFYKLKGFNEFLKLIEKGDIYVLIYLKEGLNKLGDYKIVNRGMSFRIKPSSIYKLFTHINQ